MSRRAVIALSLGLVALVLMFASGRSQFRTVGGYYAGYIPEVGHAQITFWKRSDGYRGRLWVEGFGEAWRLEPAESGDGHAAFLAYHWEDGRQTNGLIRLAGVIGGGRLTAKWAMPQERDHGQEFTLTNVAVASGIAVERNLSFKDRGGWYQMHLAGPTWTAGSPGDRYHKFFTELLENDLRELKEEFGGSIRNAWNGFREGYWAIVECERYCEIRLLSSKLISVLADGYYSRGGNGDPQKYHGRSFVNDGSGFVEFALPALFRTDGEWKPSVLELCRQRLAMQGRHPSAAAIHREIVAADGNFTVSQTGLQIYFNPYTIGSGAEGSAVVHVAYSEIVHLFDTNGLARWLPCFQTPP